MCSNQQTISRYIEGEGDTDWPYPETFSLSSYLTCLLPDFMHCSSVGILYAEVNHNYYASLIPIPQHVLKEWVWERWRLVFLVLQTDHLYTCRFVLGSLDYS